METVRLPLYDQLFSEVPELLESERMAEIMESARDLLEYKIKFNSVISRASCLSDWIGCERKAFDTWDRNTEECVRNVSRHRNLTVYSVCITIETGNYLFNSDSCEAVYNLCGD